MARDVELVSATPHSGTPVTVQDPNQYVEFKIILRVTDPEKVGPNMKVTFYMDDLDELFYKFHEERIRGPFFKNEHITIKGKYRFVKPGEYAWHIDVDTWWTGLRTTVRFVVYFDFSLTINLKLVHNITTDSLPVPVEFAFETIPENPSNVSYTLHYKLEGGAWNDVVLGDKTSKIVYLNSAGRYEWYVSALYYNQRFESVHQTFNVNLLGEEKLEIVLKEIEDVYTDSLPVSVTFSFDVKGPGEPVPCTLYYRSKEGEWVEVFLDAKRSYTTQLAEATTYEWYVTAEYRGETHRSQIDSFKVVVTETPPPPPPPLPDMKVLEEKAYIARFETVFLAPQETHTPRTDLVFFSGGQVAVDGERIVNMGEQPAFVSMLLLEEEEGC